jgi:GntR family transcriptional repressor for pyruvate dehydrogenase complex
MKTIYKSLQRQPNLADQVVDQIKDLIAHRHLRPGDKLPPERELTEHLGVSRTVIREATRTLVAQGLIEIRPSSGMVIARPTPGTVAETVGLLLRMSSDEPYADLFEVRRLLEVEIAGLAAERRTEDNLVELVNLVRLMNANLDAPEQFAESDVQFHSALARATQNPIFTILLDSIADLMLEIRYKAVSVPVNIESAAKHHVRILERVRERNAEGARQAMTAHIIEGEQHMRMAIQSESAERDPVPAPIIPLGEI